MATAAWQLEQVAVGVGEEIANSVADRLLTLQADVTSISGETGDIAAVKAVTDAIPDAGAMSDLALIKAVTDVLPDSGALTSISDETDKIDGAATDGMSGTANSLAYRVAELERHFHNRERWWGATGAPTETNAIAATVTVPFAATSGANAWGAAIPICGTADDPTPGDGDTKFDCHRVLGTDLDDDTTPWRLRIIWGSGTSGDAITAGQWTEVMIMTNAVPGNRAGAIPVPVIMRRVDVGVKLWCSAWNATGGEVLSFFYGVHGYVG